MADVHEGHTRIEDHGVVGDLATVALVGTDASIDFCCWPRFDSPTVFARLLDPERGGHFQIAPILDGSRTRQLYLPDTNILLTRFHAEGGVAEVADFMSTTESSCGRALIRWVRTIKGEVEYRATCAPRFDYARVGHGLVVQDGAVSFIPQGQGLPRLRLKATVPLAPEGADVASTFTLKAGETATFVLHDGHALSHGDDPSEFGRAAFDETLAFWRRWSARSHYRGRWREVVNRSALVLKLLTSREHGSLVAAATFGLPEEVGGSRNWDYRYAWVRDAAFTMYALIRLGHLEEAVAFTRWVQDRMTDTDDGTPLQIMYGIDGRRELPESELTELSGYRGSRPVRIGNAAHDQLQLDIYGELMDACYLAAKYAGPVSYDAWTGLAAIVDWVCDNWCRPDAGIWETRSEPRHYLHSRLMCWVAVDRGLRLAGKLSLPAPLIKWSDARTAIHRDIFDNFWDEDRETFVQYRGGTALDASILLMPLVKFIGPKDPRWLSTLDAIGAGLADDGLVRRYRLDAGSDDGLDGEEGSFGACSFWYVECLARGAPRRGAAAVRETLGLRQSLGLVC